MIDRKLISSVFSQYSVQRGNIMTLPVEAFEKHFGVSAKDCSILWNVDVLSPGDDWNLDENGRYLRIRGVYVAVAVLNALEIRERRGSHEHKSDHSL